MAEVMRLSCTAPVTVDHKVLVDSEIAGYRIPKGTLVCTKFSDLQLYINGDFYHS